MKTAKFIFLFLVALFGTANATMAYTVSGKVYVISSGIIGLENVKVYSTYPYEAVTYTDASGNYTFENVPASTLMTIYAEKDGYAFSPDHFERMVTKDYSNLDFTATTIGYSISGKVTYNSGNLDNVLITSSDGKTTTTTANGIYSITGITASSVTLTPSKTGYVFSPESKTLSMTQNYTDQDFAASMPSNSVPVTFYYQSSGSTPNAVYLAGSMNEYASANPSYRLYEEGNGLFSITVYLAPGDYVYKYVVDGNWITDPWNSLTDGSEYGNSKITVANPMISYLLPLSGNYSSPSLPEIKAFVATNSSLTSTNYSLKINSNAIQGTPIMSNGNQTFAYTPYSSELQNGTNTCELTVVVGDQTISKTIQFEYTVASGHSVGGQVTTLAEKMPLAGVVINYAGGSVTTDANGNYLISSILDNGITLEPVKEDYTFTPDRINLELTQDYTEQNFTATYSPGGGNGDVEKFPYTVSGTISVCGNPIENVAIESRGKTVYTNAEGYYLIKDTVERDYTMIYEPKNIDITVNSDTYTFNDSPYQISFTGATYDFSNVDFIGYNTIDSITGNVSYENGMPIAGAALKWEMIYRDQLVIDSIVYTNANGNYSVPHFYDRDATLTFKIAPQILGYNYGGEINVWSSQSCDNIKNKNFTVTLKPTPICMVSVSETGHNIVVWEKPDINVISGFKIYRESNFANMYDSIGYVPYTETAVFEDANSEPTTKAYRYKIGTVTTYNGAETDLSGEHKTIHLTINKGIGNSWNLIWSAYEGLDISTYKLYKGTSADNMTFLTDIAGTLTSYTDQNSTEGDVFYQIEMILEDACNPEVAKPLLKSTKAGSFYSSTKSNIANSANASTDINKIIEDKNFIYPNPVENTLYFKNSKALNEFEIYSIQGALIKQGVLNTSIDVSNLQSGLYHIRVKNDEKWESFRFIKK